MNKRIQVIVYRKNANDIETLILKRSEEDGGFWQFVTGTPEENEADMQALERELLEETGISKESIVKFIPKFKTFSWTKKDLEITENVYAVEVEPNTQVVLSIEHENYKWVDIKECEKFLVHDSTKDNLRKLIEII